MISLMFFIGGFFIGIAVVLFGLTLWVAYEERKERKIV